MTETKRNKMWWTYLVLCSNGSYYAGISTDVEQRVCAHNQGRGAKYTRAHRPVKLVYSEQWLDRSKASIREAELKKLTHLEKQNLHQQNIKGNYE